MTTAAARPIRILLVDDHRSVLWGLEKLIEGEKPRMEVVAKATNGAEAITLADATKPDVVLLDLDLAGENGAEIIPQLVRDRPTRVIILTGMRESPERDQAFLRGAHGLVEKEAPAESILKAIEKVHHGELWLDRNTTGRIFLELSRGTAVSVPAPDPDQQKIASLTSRELEIVARIAKDPAADGRKLAESLSISEHTLRNHLSRIYDKLGVSGRLALYVYAQKHRLEKSQE